MENKTKNNQSFPSFFSLKKNLKKDYSKLKKVKIAILGDCSTQLLTQVVKGYGYEVGLNFEIYEAGYNQIDREIFDNQSELFKFQPEFVIILQSSLKLLNSFYKLNELNKKNFAANHLSYVKSLLKNVNSQIKTKIIYTNFVEIQDGVFGNFGNKLNHSFTYQLRKINYLLMDLSQLIKNLFINDVSSLNNYFGQVFVFDPKLYVTADQVFSLDFLPYMAKNIVDIIQPILGRVKKCLILDLDNTLWGGIIGDDGMENIQIGDLGIGKAFTQIQHWVKQLKDRGIILAICSKNTEGLAKEPFEKHVDMVLRMDDISVFVANWNNKIDNIRYIQSILNIGFDSMVFLDDTPFERNLVKLHFPEITVPDLPDDPSDYIYHLKYLNLFETASYSSEDSKRTKQYQQEAKREKLKLSFSSIENYLKNLKMVSEVKFFNKFDIPRLAQLTQRSNQFNLRTIRYTEKEISHIVYSKDYLTLSFRLKDKFGDYGLINLIILKKENLNLFIDTWIMSCRVLKRDMEKFILNQIIKLTQQNKVKEIIGEYLPTKKNVIVKNLYKDLGFKKRKNKWYLKVDEYKFFKTFINEK